MAPRVVTLETARTTLPLTPSRPRLLQVSIFSMLHKDVKQLDFNSLLLDVVTIADEVDAQLKQQMLRFMAADAAKAATGA